MKPKPRTIKDKTRRQMVGACTYSILWPTKFKREYIQKAYWPTVENSLKNTAEEYGGELLGVSIHASHVCVLVTLTPTDSVYDFISTAKVDLANALREVDPTLTLSRVPIFWSNTFMVKTVGEAIAPSEVKQYLSRVNANSRLSSAADPNLLG